jgi:pilus assembly protein CpaE
VPETALKEVGQKGRSVVTVISERPSLLQQVRSGLSAVPDYEVREIGLKAALAAGGLRAQADLVLFDIGSGDILSDQRIFEFRRALAVPFIAISEELAPEHLRRLVQLNASDWLRQPLQGRELLNGISELLQGRRLHKSDVFAFVPCSGGVGASSLAIAAAALLARKGESTCLIDLDFAAGACGQYLDIENEFSLDTVIRSPERIDLELLDIVRRDHYAGFSLLSFRRPDLQISDVSEEFVYRLVDTVTYRFPRVVVDMPSYPTRWSENILHNSDQVFLVTERTVPALKNARQMQRKLLDGGKAQDKISIILNKDRRRMFSVSIGRSEILRLFESKQTHILPDSWALLSESLNRGVPAVSVNRRAKLVKRFGRILNEATAGKRKKKS